MTILEKSGDVSFCEPIGHFQERGDYQYSWQPAEYSKNVIIKAQDMARKMVLDLGGSGIFGVEFSIEKRGRVIFSELSPRPHDTGMVTMYTQNYSQFDIHARVLLGLPLPEIKLNRSGASHVILADENATGNYSIEGVEKALEDKSIDFRIFGKPDVLHNFIHFESIKNAKRLIDYQAGPTPDHTNMCCKHEISNR